MWNWVLPFIPIGVQVLAGQLIARDKDDVGFDDAMGQALIDMSPAFPELVAGRTVNDIAADRIMLALFRTAESYLRRRNKLPGQVASDVTAGRQV